MKHALLLGLLAAGCEPTHYSNQSSTYRCPPQPSAHRYRLVAVERSGSCGALPALVESAALARDPSCTYRAPPESDTCELDIDLTCPFADAPGWSVSASGSVTRALGMEVGGLRLQITSPTAVECMSLYDLKLIRL